MAKKWFLEARRVVKILKNRLNWPKNGFQKPMMLLKVEKIDKKKDFKKPVGL